MNSKRTIELLFAIVSLGGMIAIPGLMIGQQQQPAYAARIDEDGLGIFLEDLDIALDEEDIALDEDGLGIFLEDLDRPLDEE
jgi:hypothetical protein